MAEGSGSELSRPDWIMPALRCGLEITLIVLNTIFLAVHIDWGIAVAFVLVAGSLGSILLLFWCIKQHVVEWITYASKLTRRRRRRSRQ